MRNLTGELSAKITAHQSRVRKVLFSEPLRHAKVVQLVMVGMSADQPLESNFFPGLLEGLLGRLGIAAPRESQPPTSSRESAGWLWSSAICEAVLQMEQRQVETPGSAGLPQSLDLQHEEDFLEKQSHQVLAVFTDPFFVPDMANAVYKVFKPPVLSRASPFAGGSKVPSISTQPEDGGADPEVPAPSTSGTSHHVQPQVIKVSDTDSDKAKELAAEKETPPQVLTVKLKHNLRKQPRTGSSKDGATPAKMRKEIEVEDTKTTTSTRPSEMDLQAARFKIYDKDFPEVKKVCANILGLPEGEEVT